MQHDAAAVPLPAHGSHHEFVFTGSGREYFRIWIVDTCLTLVTIGLYAPWAEVHRLQYFARNTRLQDAAFDFHGEPYAIARDRVVVAALLAGCLVMSTLSRFAGLLLAVILLATLPLLLRRALHHRLANTSYRGVRFGFGGTASAAYRTYGPLLLLLAAPLTVLFVVPGHARPVAAAAAPYLLTPFLHAQVRRYEHNGLRYGAAQAQCYISSGDCFAVYCLAALSSLACLSLLALSARLIATASGTPHAASWLLPAPGIVLACGAIAVCLLAIPYVRIRICNAAWSATAFPGITIRSSLRVRPLVRLQAVNALLTLLTFGLYLPFARVRLHRRRLACMSVICERDLSS